MNKRDFFGWLLFASPLLCGLVWGLLFHFGHPLPLPRNWRPY